MRIFLIGPSGVGKSTVAPLLATQLGLPVLDSDLELQRLLGRPLATLFASEGEPAFRRHERELLLNLAAASDAVVVVGAGALADPAVATALRAAGRVVLLDATPATLAARLGRAGDRPLLAGATDLLALLLAQRATRDPLYRAAAHHALDTDALAPPAVSDAVRAWLASAPR